MDSWWLKVRRAEKHLRELKRLLARESKPRPQDVLHEVDPENGEHVYSITARAQPDPEIAVVVGDLLYNLRSALDHSAVALAPNRKQKDSTFFPILVTDVWHRDANRRYAERDPTDRRRWRSATRGWPPGAVEYVTKIQPYKVRGSKHHYLAVLNRLNNADKHRRLVPVVHHFSQVGFTARGRDGFTVPFDMGERTYRDREEVIRYPEEREVQIKAAVEVAISSGGDGFYEIPAMCETLVGFVRDEVLPALDPIASP